MGRGHVVELDAQQEKRHQHEQLSPAPAGVCLQRRKTGGGKDRGAEHDEDREPRVDAEETDEVVEVVGGRIELDAEEVRHRRLGHDGPDQTDAYAEGGRKSPAIQDQPHQGQDDDDVTEEQAVFDPAAAVQAGVLPGLHECWDQRIVMPWFDVFVDPGRVDLQLDDAAVNRSERCAQRPWAGPVGRQQCQRAEQRSDRRHQRARRHMSPYPARCPWPVFWNQRTDDEEGQQPEHEHIRKRVVHPQLQARHHPGERRVT